MRAAPFFMAMAALCAGHSASAATQLSLTYDSPTGTVSPTDVVSIRATLRNDGPSAFEVASFRTVQGVDLGMFSPHLVPGYELADIAHAVTTQFVECGGTFAFIPCAMPEASNYELLIGQGLPGNLLLNPGESVSLDIGSLVPLSEAVAPGQYTISNIGLVTFAFTDDFVPISFYDLTQTCASRDQGCAFVRTVAVSAVPEVETWMTFLVGFGAIGAVMRHRRKVIPTALA